MRFLFQVLATVALVAHGAFAESDIIKSDVYGEGHGDDYSDEEAVTPGQIVHAIHIRAGHRVNAVGIDFTDAYGLKTNVTHGGDGGDPFDLTIDPGDYITAMEAHTGKKDGRTRIVYIQFATKCGKTVEGGRRTNSIAKAAAPKGYQLGGFYGTSGKELDSVGILWTPVEKVVEGSSAAIRRVL